MAGNVLITVQCFALRWCRVTHGRTLFIFLAGGERLFEGRYTATWKREFGRTLFLFLGGGERRRTRLLELDGA